uniref:Glycosyltransferase subfamily 4-like N-terminal domain-containing protein n=1 Tax=Rhodosorus marinus TaxID=101924 RepID=A0A7S0BNH8_9RHOD|mmetsp:Transcript_23794/g.34194  ORF Transcript_23794/g.34194 Transcript_23794/m.34194 type:complete len:525 (+) Transcript_23794:167-1741(+)
MMMMKPMFDEGVREAQSIDDLLAQIDRTDLLKEVNSEDSYAVNLKIDEILSLIDRKDIVAEVEPEEQYAVTSEDEAELERAYALPKAQKSYKIAMFAWESMHSIAVGEVAPHVTNVASALEKRGHEVHVYVRTGKDQGTYENVDGVHVHRVSFELCENFVQEVENMCNVMVTEFFNTERFMGSQFDIVHCHDWLAAPVLLNLKKYHDRYCVFTVHSTEFGRCGNNFYGGQSEAIRGIEAEAINVANRVIAVSGVLCDELKEHNQFDWRNLRCVPSGIDILPYDGELWDPAYIRGFYKVGPLDPMVLYNGKMVGEKGPDILIDAVPMLLASRPDAKFVMVGDGYMKDELIGRCASMGISGSVIFPGALTGRQLVELYKTTDVVCMPSRSEPFGMVALEAWASSKPVVATNCGAPREFIAHDKDGFVVDANPEGIAWGVGTIFANFDHARWMGTQGQLKAADDFSWIRIAEKTNEVYDQMTGFTPRRMGRMSAVESKAKRVEKKKRKQKKVQENAAVAFLSKMVGA